MTIFRYSEYNFNGYHKMAIAVPNPILLKAAAGDSQTFETALAGIGRSVIASRAPSVSKNEIGFQVLDQDDDNTRAVGVFGYKIGGRLFYVPMFYRDGVTKGVEQLRDPKRKRTVPLTDNWINKLTVEKGDDPPTLVDRSSISQSARPSLWQLKAPPTKWASDPTYLSDLELIRKDLSRGLINGGPLTGNWTDALDLFKTAAEHPSLMRAVDEMTQLYPWFADAVDRYHEPEKIASALERVELVKLASVKRPKRTHSFAKKAAGPRIVTVRVTKIALNHVPFGDTDYTPGELKELESGNNIYSDRRGDDEVSVLETIYGGGPGGGTSLSNPSMPGVQNVLGDDLKLHACAVMFPLTGWEVAPGACLVVRVKDGAWCTVDRNTVWVLANDGVDLDAGLEWWKGLKKPTETPPKGRVSAVFMESGKHLHATVPFSSDENGYIFDSSVYTDRPYWARIGETRPTDGNRTNESLRKYRVIDGAARMITAASTLYLPGKDHTRFVELGYDQKKFRPANGDDPSRFLAPGIKAASEGAHVITVKRSSSGTFSYQDPRINEWVDIGHPADLEAVLVEEHHFRPKAARDVIQLCKSTKEAHAIFRYPVSTKKADQAKGQLETNFPNAPNSDPIDLTAPNGFADDVLPSQAAQSLAIPIPDAGELPGDRERYQTYPMEAGMRVPLPGIGNSGDVSGDGPKDPGLTADDARRVAGAAQSGVKELFDTAAIAALVKRKRIDPVVDKIIRSGGAVMNDLADGLCHMYWNSDAWSDRFGQSEIGALEDQFRDHFEGIGDLCLSLQEKAVDGGRDFGLLPELAGVDASRSGGA